MKNPFATIFKKRDTLPPKEYRSFSEFFLHASPTAKKEILIKAAQQANEDQLKIFKEAMLKVKA